MSHSTSDNDQGNSERSNYLGLEIPYRALYLVLATVVATTVIFALMMIPMVRGAIFLDDEKTEVTRGLEASTARPGGPLLQPKPENDMKIFRASEDAAVHSFGWQDRSAGIAKIPLSEARKLVLRDGVAPIAATPTPSEDGIDSQ
jgi:hypothetical protein